MEYKILYHEGEQIGISTVIKTGILTEEKKSFIIKNKKGDKIDINTINSVKKVAINGIGNLLKVDFLGKIVYLAAYKGICIANFFATIDEDATNKIHERIVLRKK